MKKLLSLLVLVPTLALAGELNGVKMPDAQQIAGKETVLNGMGLRKKFVFKVYVAGLYLEKKTQDPKEVLASDQIRRIQMHMLRSLDRKAMAEAIENGFRKNNEAAMPKLQDRLNKLLNDLPEQIAEGDDVIITYLPGKGTQLMVKGKEGLSIEGKDFADAMFSVYFGKEPVSEDLRDGMLGKSS